ncbi:tRNA (adenosine(37)-N6)-threonylcarbamoyltransferase complex ATPase subunit type 1 TsaE [Alkaliphilus peptidifermentans]|uniref:tRNA threonylcarbamoyladenosine biosynthesis protein TsaE n=1 Tax=Alkaliphilus peptidifermentans DSM 18978 TaxID=1120976 RepID=A0A1G5IDL8_9FIRM|nr:tRNA (adenosine(37)-N6)-threonylcarbamoyltransferase complex ATPase subunit type 1 TsaE [Alkaliphilus peptidifermentans]SCY74212.1 tRNA threonylcarbamoyladenosine biosynthesis protein TsaE [Alkaliphilus peptidifermentans DSM 18978]
MKCIKLNNQQETEAIAEKLGSMVKKGDIICLTGDLGAGKTVFSKSFAKGLGVQEVVTSPTFTIVQEYQGRIPMYHFDVYRVNQPHEMDDIGFDEYVFGDGVCIIEWASIIKEILPENCLWIEIQVTGAESRTICVEDQSQNYKNIIKELLMK